jgi:hypothetical protein
MTLTAGGWFTPGIRLARAPKQSPMLAQSVVNAGGDIALA